MVLNPKKWSGWLAFLLFALTPVSYSGLRHKTNDSESFGSAQRSEPVSDPAENTAVEPEADPSTKLKDEMISGDGELIAKPVVKAAPKRIDRADAFVAGPDWEFDGFVSGGQDSSVRSMFYLNDLIYLNIGSQQGIGIGDKVGIYKRGDKVRDPQTGKFIGYEVRRAAIAKATDRVEEETCAVRISNTYEAVELGDLVRREQ